MTLQFELLSHRCDNLDLRPQVISPTWELSPNDKKTCIRLFLSAGDKCSRLKNASEGSWKKIGANKEALIHRTVHEMQLLRAALPTPADLEAIAYRFETSGSREVDLHDGTTFDASMFLRRAARLIRLAINEEAEPRDQGTNLAAHG